MSPCLCTTMLCWLLCQAPSESTNRPAAEDAATVAEGLLSLNRPALVAQLQLSPDRIRTARQEIVDYQMELRALYGDYPPGAQDAEGEQVRQRLRTKHAQRRDATLEHLTDLLTARQQEQLATLTDLYADNESPAPPDRDIKPRPVVQRANDAQLRQETRGLIYILQDNRAGALVPWADHAPTQRFQDLAVEVSGPGVHLVIGNRRQAGVFWHAADRVITAIAVSPGRKFLATGTGRFPDGRPARKQGEVRVWEITSGRLVHKTFFPDDVSVVGFRDEETVLVGLTPRGGR